jgi:thiamine kinase-like enzyme
MINNFFDQLAIKKANILARHPKDLTVEWAQCVINQHDSEVRVSRVEILNVDVGTTTRVKIAVEHDGAKYLPKQWFVKMPSLAWRARWITALPRLLQTESRFYNEISPLISLNLPHFLAAESKLGHGAIVVLADLKEFYGAAGHPSDALTEYQAAEVVQELARFHARFAQQANLARHYPWLASSVRKLEDALGTAMAVPLMQRGLQLAGTIVPTQLHKSALRYAKQRRNMMAFLSDAPQTLIHHDCHAGNLFWRNNNEVGFLDWQLVRLGEGVSDVAYFLATALEPQTRRLHEENLLNLYAKTLNQHGIANASKESLMPRYRAHCVYALEAMLVTLAVGGMMKLESNLELIRRAASAVQDLDSFSVLP